VVGWVYAPNPAFEFLEKTYNMWEKPLN